MLLLQCKAQHLAGENSSVHKLRSERFLLGALARLPCTPTWQIQLERCNNFQNLVCDAPCSQIRGVNKSYCPLVLHLWIEYKLQLVPVWKDLYTHPRRVGYRKILSPEFSLYFTKQDWCCSLKQLLLNAVAFHRGISCHFCVILSVILYRVVWLNKVKKFPLLSRERPRVNNEFYLDKLFFVRRRCHCCLSLRSQESKWMFGVYIVRLCHDVENRFCEWGTQADTFHTCVKGDSENTHWHQKTQHPPDTQDVDRMDMY